MLFRKDTHETETP